jgi:hypothetical protein
MRYMCSLLSIKFVSAMHSFSFLGIVRIMRKFQFFGRTILRGHHLFAYVRNVVSSKSTQLNESTSGKAIAYMPGRGVQLGVQV